MNSSPGPLDVETYCDSGEYAGDLVSAQAVWSSPDIVETAGSLVLLTYFATPSLLSVQPPGGSLRAAVDGHRERRFLEGMLGLTSEPRRVGGIRNADVRHAMQRLRDGHLEFPGMVDEYMRFVAGILALAPLSIRTHNHDLIAAAEIDRYWRYMVMAMSLLGGKLGSALEVDTFCSAFVDRHAAASDIGDGLIRAFHERHPRHVADALPVLRPAARQVVEGACSVRR